jgi:hypothetical protein
VLVVHKTTSELEHAILTIMLFASAENNNNSLSIMHKLINTKHHCSNSVREHIMYLCNLCAKLNAIKMRFDDPFMLHLALVSLPDEYVNLVSSYNNMKEKWTIDELISHVVLEEEQ